MVEWVQKTLQRPKIAHLVRAQERYNARLGRQFAAAMAYFSVLTIVPVAMFAFAVTGFVFERNPEILVSIQREIEEMLAETASGGDGISENIINLIQSVLSDYRAVAVTSLVVAVYTGSNWVKNLKDAIRAQWRPEFDAQAGPQRNFVVELLINVLHLFILMAMIAITLALASAGTALNDWMLGLLGLQDAGWASWVFRAGPALLSVIAGYGLFSFIYWVFPQYPVPHRERAIGAFIAALGLGVLQYGAGLLTGLFEGNKSFTVFGPVIILMLVINLFGTLTLLVAAWIATTDEPGVPERDDHTFDPHSRVLGPSMPPPAHRTRALGTARRRVGSVPEALDWEPGQGQPWVTQEVAQKSVRAGLGAGWVAGTAAGVGVGAAVAGLMGRLRGWRRRPKD